MSCLMNVWGGGHTCGKCTLRKKEIYLLILLCVCCFWENCRNDRERFWSVSFLDWYSIETEICISGVMRTHSFVGEYIPDKDFGFHHKLPGFPPIGDKQCSVIHHSLFHKLEDSLSASSLRHAVCALHWACAVRHLPEWSSSGQHQQRETENHALQD